MIRVIFLLIWLFQIALANICQCIDITDRETCNSGTYDGICNWDDGMCLEKLCHERTRSQSCETQYGSYWCGWVDNSKCVDPTSCSHIAGENWCKLSGCLWSENKCHGKLNQITCSHLTKETCNSYFYIYDEDVYEKCLLDSSGTCKSARICLLYSSESHCDPSRCKWDSVQEECNAKQCSDFTSQETCRILAGDDQEYFLCKWDSMNSKCISLDCDQITDETTCSIQAGQFCKWDTGKCYKRSCEAEKSKDACLHETLIEGGASTCTWVTSKGGRCLPCNNEPFAYQNFKNLVFGSTFFVLIMVLC